MPFVTIRTIAGLLDAPRKRELTERISDLLVEIEGGGHAGFRDQVWVSIEETPPENWRLGQTQPSAERIAGFVALRDRAR